MATATAPVLLRSVRSDQVRDLARRAVDQGWDLYPNGGGHLAAVNPSNGAQVVLSTTSNGTGRTVANTRAALRRAGLDLRSKAELRRASRQEAHAMTMHTSPESPPEVLGTRPAATHPKAHRAGGAFALDPEAQVEDLDIMGQRVSITQRQDGVWLASMRDTSQRTGRRRWSSKADRAELVARVTRDLEEGRPTTARSRRGSYAKHGDVAPVVAPFVAERVNGAGTFHVVQVDPEEYPLAAALAALDAALAPALDALDAAGKGDAAGLLRAEVTRTPVEEELLDLYRRVMTGA